MALGGNWGLGLLQQRFENKSFGAALDPLSLKLLQLRHKNRNRHKDLGETQ